MCVFAVIPPFNGQNSASSRQLVRLNSGCVFGRFKQITVQRTLVRGLAGRHTHPMKTIARYDRAASNWELRIFQNGYLTAYQELLKSEIKGSGRVLDAGTGTGTFARVWAEAGGSRDLTLFDPSWKMLNAAQANLATINVIPKIVQARVEDFEPQTPYATILAAHVIEHCAAPGMALRHFADWLEPGGRLFLVVSKPHWCNWLIWLRFRHRWFSAKTVLQMASNVGLTPLKTHAFQSGPPSRTSLGYLFLKPERK